MSAAVDALLDDAATSGPPTDGTPHVRNGRYHLLHPTTGKPITAQRASNFAKVLQDTYQLERWAERQVLVGAALRPDITAQVVAAGTEDKRKLDALAEAAKEAAGGSAAANLGTAMHDILDQVDAGRDVAMTPTIAADVAAYRRALVEHRLEIVASEQVVFNEALGVAGRFDRIYRHEGALQIGDIKTGSYLAWGAFALQLAIYARAEWMWDDEGKAWAPMPGMDLDTGLVVHLPVGVGRCDVWAVDIGSGWDACQLATRVKAWRNRRDLATKLATTPAPEGVEANGAGGGTEVTISASTSSPGATPHDEALDAWVATANDLLRARLATCVERLPGGMLPPGIAWPERVRTFRDGGPRSVEGVRLVEVFVNHLESHLDIGFSELPPLPTAPEAATVEADATPIEDHGALAVELLAPWAPDEQRALVLAATGGVPLEPSRFGPKPLERLRVLLAGLDGGVLALAYEEEAGGTDSRALLTVERNALDAALLRRFDGSKAAQLEAARLGAKALGRPTPRSAAESCTDPVLAAALATGHPSTNPPPTGETDD